MNTIQQCQATTKKQSAKQKRISIKPSSLIEWPLFLHCITNLAAGSFTTSAYDEPPGVILSSTLPAIYVRQGQ